MSGPLPGWLAPIAWPAACAYGAAVWVRNRGFDRGRRVQRMSRPVISVGNIVAGGTGKTPMVRWLAARLEQHDVRPVIAMRGYRGGGESSDEAREYRAALPGVPVLEDPARAAALQRYLPAHPEVDCILLDDGFQHRFVGRDLDLVLVDATRPCLSDHLLPAGWLREPASNLARADGVVVTRATRVDQRLADAIASKHGAPPLAWCRHRWMSLALHGSERADVEIDWLRGKRVATMLGVGNPAAVTDQVRGVGAMIAMDFGARDHERYAAARVRAFLASCSDVDALVVTAKDWVKLERLIDWRRCPMPVAVPRLEIEFLAGEERLWSKALAAIEAHARAKESSTP
jgi:tetraacyldisaccharide 4'-kinase